jgi:hypothetical protein
LGLAGDVSHPRIVRVPHDTRRETCSRTLPVQTEAFSRWEDRNKTLELTPKPQELPEGSVDQRSWHQYQAYLSRIRPIARADFYRRLMESRGLKSIRALAGLTGEDWSRIAKVLKLLELPEPILAFLRAHDSPEIAATFTERQLRELLALKDHRRIWNRFQSTLRSLGWAAKSDAP